MMAMLKIATMNTPEIMGDIKKIKPKAMPMIGNNIIPFGLLAIAGTFEFFKLRTMPKPKIDLNNTQKPNKKQMTKTASPAGIETNKIPMMISIAPDNNDQPQLLLSDETEKTSKIPVIKNMKPTK